MALCRKSDHNVENKIKWLKNRKFLVFSLEKWTNVLHFYRPNLLTYLNLTLPCLTYFDKIINFFNEVINDFVESLKSNFDKVIFYEVITSHLICWPDDRADFQWPLRHLEWRRNRSRTFLWRPQHHIRNKEFPKKTIESFHLLHPFLFSV